MPINKFILLSKSEKQKLVSAYGVFLGYDEDQGNICDIYALFKFYVEFDYDIERNEGIFITACQNIEDLPTIEKVLGSKIIAEL